MKIQYQIDENGKGEALYKQLKETALITGDKFFVLEGMLKTAESVLFDLDGCNALASSFEMDKLTDEHSRAQMQADLGLACIMLAMRELANGGALYCACKQAVEVRNTIPVEPFTAQDRRALKVLKRVCQLSSKMFVAITVAGVENAQSQYSFNCSKFTASQDIVRICAFVAGQVANALRDICGQVSHEYDTALDDCNRLVAGIRGSNREYAQRTAGSMDCQSIRSALRNAREKRTEEEEFFQHLQAASKSLCAELIAYLEAHCRRDNNPLGDMKLFSQFSMKGPGHPNNSYWAVRQFVVSPLLHEWTSEYTPERQKEDLMTWLTDEAPRTLFKEIVNNNTYREGYKRLRVRNANDKDLPLYGSSSIKVCGNIEGSKNRQFGIRLSVSEIIDQNVDS